MYIFKFDCCNFGKDLDPLPQLIKQGIFIRAYFVKGLGKLPDSSILGYNILKKDVLIIFHSHPCNETQDGKKMEATVLLNH